jgi:hypothetical protein
VRRLLLLPLVALGIGGMGFEAQAACNIRGEFCGYPSWAANAFSHPRDRVPNWVLDNPTNKYAGAPYGAKYRAKRHRRSYR